MVFYLFMAVAASIFFAIGLLMMKSRAEALPAARGVGTLRAVWTWCRDPVWLGGLGIQIVGLALYITGLSGAPVSLVAVVMQGGIAFFVLFAVLFLGERAKAAEWIGIAGVLLAMLLLALSLGAGAEEQGPDPRALAILSVVLLAGAAGLGAAPGFRRRGIAAAILSGVAFGLASLYTKALTEDFLVKMGMPLIARITSDPFVYLAIAANICGLIMLQNAFHRARGIIVMPLSSALSNLVPIGGGIIAFGERLPSDPFAATMRAGAFALTVGAGALFSVAGDPDN